MSKNSDQRHDANHLLAANRVLRATIAAALEQAEIATAALKRIQSLTHDRGLLIRQRGGEAADLKHYVELSAEIGECLQSSRRALAEAAHQVGVARLGERC